MIVFGACMSQMLRQHTRSRASCRHGRRRGGFTLIETIATITVLAVLGSMASMLVMTSVNGFTGASTAAQLHTEASIALDRIDRAMRDIPNHPTVAGAADIASITASSITWQTNYSLSLSGGQLMLVENGGTSRVLLSDVASFSVQAYDESNTALASSLSGSACEPVQRVRFTVTLERNGVSHTLRSKVYLRGVMTS
jgi:prepilin-type N-terminal cleavage/methylation domain-containing protein